MTCKMCGKDMGNVNSQRFYCSDACKHKAWKERNPENAKELRLEYDRRKATEKKTAKTIDTVKQIDPQNLTIQQFCHEFLCGDSYISKCIGQGMPYHVEDGKKRFDLEKCQAWHRGEEVT